MVLVAGEGQGLLPEATMTVHYLMTCGMLSSMVVAGCDRVGVMYLNRGFCEMGLHVPSGVYPDYICFT